MLYLNTSTYEVTREKPTGSYETFTPTVDVEQGWIVILKYHTYDSFSVSKEAEYEVIDIYSDRAKAIELAEGLVEEFRGWSQEKKTHDREYNNGKPIKYLPVGGWGSSLDEVIVHRVTVKDNLDTLIFH